MSFKEDGVEEMETVLALAKAFVKALEAVVEGPSEETSATNSVVELGEPAVQVSEPAPADEDKDVEPDQDGPEETQEDVKSGKKRGRGPAKKARRLVTPEMRGVIVEAMSLKPLPRLQVVADRLGVSPSTVSRIWIEERRIAANGRPRVDEPVEPDVAKEHEAMAEKLEFYRKQVIEAEERIRRAALARAGRGEPASE